MRDDNLTIEELIEKADRSEEVGDLNNALLYWRAAVTRESDPIMLCRLGNVAMELGALEEAQQAFRSAIDMAPDVPTAHNMLGLLYLERGELESAHRCFKRSAEIQESARTLTFLGSVQLQIGLTANARESLTKALQLDPDDEEAYYNLGLTFREEQAVEAARLFQKAIEIDQDYGLAHRELGWTLLRMHKYRESERHIRRAIELDASDGWAYIYLGNVLWKKRDLPSAERAFIKATDVWPDESTAYWCLADFYEHTDRGREADLCYEKALELNPDDPVANVRFGLYLKETGEPTKAKTYLERALGLDPEDERARSALAELDESAPPPSGINKVH